METLQHFYWQSFRLVDGEMRWFYTDEDSAIRIESQEWFNKNTIEIVIHKGYETYEHSAIPISNMIYRISIHYRIANYFGDTSGKHFRCKSYMFINDKLYNQKDGKEVKRMTKELKGALQELILK